MRRWLPVRNATIFDGPVQRRAGPGIQRGWAQHVEQQLGDLLIARGGGDAGGAGRCPGGRVVLQRHGAIGQQPGDPQVDERAHPAGPDRFGQLLPLVTEPAAHPLQQ